MTAPGPQPPAPRYPQWVVLAVACVAQFMVVLDVSIVNVALPSIGRDLHYSSTGLQWVVNAYVLTFAGFLLLGGRAADLYGRRRVFLFGLSLFTVASLVGGLATDSAWLTTARALQGVGGAVLSPATLTIIVTSYSGERLARALGVWSAVAGAGGAAGAILGGVLTAELSWRWVLFVNVPIGAAGLVVAVAALTEVRRPSATCLDVAGAVTATAGLALLVYAIVGTDTSGWGSARTLGILVGAAILLGIFAVIQLKVAATPLVPFRLFRSRAVTGANVVMLLVAAGFFSMWYFLSLHMQNVLGYGALRAGLAFVPMALGIIVATQISSRLVSRTGARPLLTAGSLLCAGGFVWLSGIGHSGGYWSDVFGAGTMVAFAVGLMFTPLASAATEGVDRAEAGLASGVLNTSRQVGGSLGLAVLATVAVDRTQSVLASARGAALRDQALTSGYSRAFAVAAALVVLGVAGASIVPARPAEPGAEPKLAWRRAGAPAAPAGSREAGDPVT